MAAQSVRNWAHIIKTPAAMSCSSDSSSDVNARPTAAKKEPMATAISALSFVTDIFKPYLDRFYTKGEGYGFSQ